MTEHISYAHRDINEGTLALNRDANHRCSAMPSHILVGAGLHLRRRAFSRVRPARRQSEGRRHGGRFLQARPVRSWPRWRLAESCRSRSMRAAKLSLHRQSRHLGAILAHRRLWRAVLLRGAFGRFRLAGHAGAEICSCPSVYGWRHAISAFADGGGAALANAKLHGPAAGLCADRRRRARLLRQSTNTAPAAFAGEGLSRTEPSAAPTASTGYDRGTVGLVQAGFTF